MNKNLRDEIFKKLLFPVLSDERAKIATKAYKESAQDPLLLRRAKMFSKILKERTIYIQDYETIVGGIASEPFAAEIFPEYSWEWILKEMGSFETRVGDKFKTTESFKKNMKELLPFWSGKSIQERAMSQFPQMILDARECKFIAFENMLTGGIGHVLPNYELLLKKGFKDIGNDIKNCLSQLDLSNPTNYQKSIFYKATKICKDAASDYILRYYNLASKMANECTDEKLKSKLSTIAKVCNNISSNAPQSFHEALQLLWFAHSLMWIDQNGLAITLGRMDQYLYPFYKKDIENGIITKDAAKDLLIAFWIKCNEVIKLYNNLASSYSAGFPITQPPQLGGFTPEGDDATNELSELILEVEEEVLLPQPDMAILWMSKMKQAFLKRAAKIIPKSMKPKIFNAEIGKQILLSLGASTKEAKNFTFVGCVEATIAGKTWGWHNAGALNLGKCLEYTFTSGKDIITEKLLGIKTSDPCSCQTFDEFLEIFKIQVAHGVKLLVKADIIIEAAHKELVPLPYESIFVEDCLKKGCDINAGGAKYNFTGIQAIGLATVTDSLMALKKMVFDEKRFSMKDFIELIKSDFEGKEMQRQLLLKGVPHFGNDIDEVDNLAKQVFDIYNTEVYKYRNLRGGKFIPGWFSVSYHVSMGDGTLTCDGRKLRDPLSDAISPAQGRTEKGPIAIVKSLSKLDHIEAANGTLLNVKFNANILRTDEQIEKLANFIRSYMQLGGYHLQFNIVDPTVLRDAQIHPEEYPNLLVRVAAYVALYNQLSKEVQDEIISRSEQSL